MKAEYIEIGGQRIRVDHCSDCGHIGHDEEPCPSLMGTLNIATGESSELVQCLCKHTDEEVGR